MNQLREWWNRPALARLFDLLFLIISVATFRHTAAGFASIEGSAGAGYLSAVGIDVTMYLAALALNTNLSRWGRVAVGAALLFAVLSSAVAQLLFSVTHAEALIIAPGATWFRQAQSIINWRVVWMPFSLPVFALLVSVAGKAQDVESVSVNAYRELQQVARNRELELDDLDALLAKVQARADHVEELQSWIDTLLSFDLSTKKGVAAMITFAHNGHTPTHKELARALDASESIVRLGAQAARKAQPRLPGINGEQEPEQGAVEAQQVPIEAEPF